MLFSAGRGSDAKASRIITINPKLMFAFIVLLSARRVPFVACDWLVKFTARGKKLLLLRCDAEVLSIKSTFHRHLNKLQRSALIAIILLSFRASSLSSGGSKSQKLLHIICNNKTKTKPAITWKFLRFGTLNNEKRFFSLKYAKKLRKATRMRSRILE